MNTASSSVKPPSRQLRWKELSAGVDIGAGLAALPWLSLAPRGDGHAVLVLPGLTASDSSTQFLRDFLDGRGYASSGWGLGRNLGPRPGVEAAMLDALDRLGDESGRTVSIVGWSLGGVYARALATRRPLAVRSVITLGSPITRSAYTPPPTLPTTSIYSRSDGIVAWPCSVIPQGPRAENIEVRSSHLGLGFNPTVLYAIADRLAQPEGQWKPFERSGWRMIAFPDPTRPDEEA